MISPMVSLVLGTQSRKDLNGAVSAEFRAGIQVIRCEFPRDAPSTQSAPRLVRDAAGMSFLERLRPKPVGQPMSLLFSKGMVNQELIRSEWPQP